jgi:hypothetical protein
MNNFRKFEFGTRELKIPIAAYIHELIQTLKVERREISLITFIKNINASWLSRKRGVEEGTCKM